jgi:hypothetical protein
VGFLTRDLSKSGEGGTGQQVPNRWPGEEGLRLDILPVQSLGVYFGSMCGHKGVSQCMCVQAW